MCICCSIVINKPNFGSAYYSACVVYTIIHFNVGEIDEHLPHFGE